MKVTINYKTVLSKTNRTIGLLRKLQNLLPRKALIPICKAFVRAHLDQAFNASFHEKLESIQCNACLALTGAIRGTSKEKLSQELGLESLQLCRWYRKLRLFYKIFKKKSPAYLLNLIPARYTHYSLRTSDNIPCFNTKHNYFKNSFFPSTIIDWNKLDVTLQKCDNVNVFKKEILKLIRPSSNYFYNCHNPIGIKYITRIRLGLSHLREHKFKHSFQDSINPICNCGNDVKSAMQFFLHCPLYSNERCTLLNSLSKIDHKLLDSTDTSLTQILLFGNSPFTTNDNTKIINLTIDFVLSTKRFDGPLL